MIPLDRRESVGKRQRPLWQIVVAWNIGVVAAFLIAPLEWKWPLVVVAFFAMCGHLIYRSLRA